MAGVYGSSPYSRTLMTGNNVVELPVRQRTVAAGHHPASCYIDWRAFGVILGLLAAATCALGVADVVYTYTTYMQKYGCTSASSMNYCNSNILVFTWIAVGIWASVPVFIFAISILRSSGMVYSKNMCLELLAFLCAIIFTSAMVALSAIEVWKGVGVYYWTASSLPSDDIVKVALPLAIACAGFVEHIMCAIALYYYCCCHGMSGGATTYVSSQPVVRTTVVSQPAHPPPQQVITTYQPTYQSSCPPKPACQSCPSPSFPQNNFFSSGGGYSRGGGYSGGGGAGCTSCPRPVTYNTQMSPNPAYNFYRS